MRVRDWQAVLETVVESSADPDGWRAVAGDRRDGVGEDMYIGHPDEGVFGLKTYAKNPFDVQGVGGRVARSIDDELDPLLPKAVDEGGRFGVRQPVESEDAEQTANELEEVLRTHADAPTSPDALFEDVMETLDAPAYGPMEYDDTGRPERLDGLADTFEEAERLLSADLEELVEESGVDRGFQ